MSFSFSKILDSGISFTDSKSERKNVVLSNYVSIIAATGVIVLLLGRILSGKSGVWVDVRLTISAILFLLPLLMNRVGLIYSSRLVMCWLPQVVIIVSYILAIQEQELLESGDYVSIRIFVLAFSIFPFLIFSFKTKYLLLAGMMAPLLSILLIDPIFNFFNVGYYQKGLQELSYSFNNIRAFVAFMILAASSFSLKRFVEISEGKNELLMAELEEKNILIQRQADDEVHQLNQRLNYNVQQLQKRELVLNVSLMDLRRAEEKLLLNQATLNATINNTKIQIWSVDRDYNLLMFNRPFANFIRLNYGVEIKEGARILEPVYGKDIVDETKEWWGDKYKRALSGEVITVEQKRFGIDFKYSLSPIIENNKIIGVSIFADDVTERRLRDRELAEANIMIGELKLMALRSVMNPHFVFNVLSSIQFYIAKNDRFNAMNYLTTFSKLMRSILTHSGGNITLADEIEILNNYVQLEMTRFEKNFEFILNVDPDLDVDGIKIPSLLIQPYVENAIVHGLYNKGDAGVLTISIKEVDDMLVVEIEDNGIGRDAAMLLKSQNFPAHASMGIKLTEERLKLINDTQQVSFKVEDLFENDSATGTRITIWVKT